MLYARDDVPESEFNRQLKIFESMQLERRSSRGLARSARLYPPGRITHLVKTGQSKKCMYGLAGCITCGASNAGSVYTPIQKENNDFNEIAVSPTLWTDHFPNRVCTEIEKIAQQFGIDTTLGSPPACWLCCYNDGFIHSKTAVVIFRNKNLLVQISHRHTEHYLNIVGSYRVFWSRVLCSVLICLIFPAQTAEQVSFMSTNFIFNLTFLYRSVSHELSLLPKCWLVPNMAAPHHSCWNIANWTNKLDWLIAHTINET